MDSRKVSDAIAQMEWLDNIGEPWQDAVNWVYRSLGGFGKKLEDFMHGKFLGHPLHAALVHLPIGAWTLAAILDLFGGSPAARAGADLAVLVGVIAAIPTALTGSTDYYVYGDNSVRRIGALHAVLNVLALVLYVFSLSLRNHEVRDFARVLSFAGFGLVSFSGYLGGLLVYEKRIGTNHSPKAEDEAAPEEYVSVMPVAQLEESKPTKVMVGEVPVVLVRLGAEVFALADRCAHQGGPLSEGDLKDGCLVCPWHQSAFRVSDGHCVSGPSVFEQATFPVRIENGQIMVKAVRPNTTSAEFPTPHGHITIR